MNVYARLVSDDTEDHGMSLHTIGYGWLPSADEPLDAVDTLLTGGGAVGILLYVVALLLGHTEAATVGVGIGVVCVLGTLTVRSVRDAVRRLG
jgi:hypothetical protein